MYEELINRLRNLSGTDNIAELDEAADAIEDLEFACNRYEKDYKALCEYLPKWIPVTEQLPESGELVIGYNGKRRFVAIVRVIGNNADSITHWMPLPQLPCQRKEETHGD